MFCLGNEVRLIWHKSNQETNYGQDVAASIKAIYLGFRISMQNKITLISIADELKVPCYQMSLVNSSYVLEKHLITVKYRDLCMVDPGTCQLINK